MTREEAIEILQKIKPIPHRGDGKSTTHILETIALDMAIKALEQQPCEDCISRQAVLEIIEREEFKGDAISEIEKISCKTPQPKAGRWGICEDTDGIHGVYSIPDIKVTAWMPLPSVTPTRPTGKWIRDTITDLYHCSECRTFYHQDVKTMDNFCPNCGARMAESEDK